MLYSTFRGLMAAKNVSLESLQSKFHCKDNDGALKATSSQIEYTFLEFQVNTTPDQEDFEDEDFFVENTALEYGGDIPELGCLTDSHSDDGHGSDSDLEGDFDEQSIPENVVDRIFEELAHTGTTTEIPAIPDV